MPEQVWDEADRPDRGLQLGKPAGSAVPLVWAHAEYLKLLRSALDGKVFDRIDPVYERYCEPEGGNAAARATWRSTACGGRSRESPRASTLRILDEDDLKWFGRRTAGRRRNTTASRSLGSAGFSADIATAPQLGRR